MRTFLVVLIIVGVSPWWGCRTEEASSGVVADPPPVTAAVAPVVRERFVATIPFTGTLVSRTRVDVKAETTGRVNRIPKEEGEQVSAGETVLSVDRENYQLAVRQAESAVQVAEASLERNKI